MMIQPANQPADQRALYRLDETHVLSTLLSHFDGMVFRCRVDDYWTMEYVSKGCAQLTGYEPASLLHNQLISYEQITLESDRARVRQHIQQALEKGERYEVEYRICRMDGEQRWVWERGLGVPDASGKLTVLEGYISDVTERKHAEQALQEAERRYRSIVENAVEGIFQSHLQGGYISVNPALARILGYSSTAQLMQSMHNLTTQLYVDPNRRAAFIRQIMASGSVTDFQSQVFRRDGTMIWISENARIVYDETGQPLFFEGTVEDITQRKTYETEIVHRASHDPLTGLPNRNFLYDRLQQALNQAESQRGLVAVAFIDLDQFKYINDSLGHHWGDTLLKIMADRLRSNLKETDTVARQGGDEFVLVITGEHDSDEINQKIERIMQIISRPIKLADHEFTMTCSVGISLSSTDGNDVDLLLQHADSAMYKAKEAGRNNYQFFAADMNTHIADKLDMFHRLREALPQQELQLFYQPKIDLDNGRIIGAEALIRWFTQDRGMISPAQFIPLAEETGLILLIGEWVLWTACEQAKIWQEERSRQGLPPISVSVNISPRQLQQGNLVNIVGDVLRETGLDPALLELEITENLLMQNADASIDLLMKLKAMGVTLSFDDFGTGYSSLSYIRKFPVDCLKVDQSFIRNILINPDDAAIVKAIVSLGHILNLTVVAEGVETVDQADFLSLCGCDFVQGYYYSRPVAVQAFTELILPLQQQAA